MVEQQDVQGAQRAQDAQVPSAAAVNEVRLTGRLPSPAQVRTLPSGDEIVQFRLVVARRPRRRPTAGAAREGRTGVDTIDCTAWTAVLRRRVLAAQAGEVLEVQGALRRRFWRGPAGPTSTYGVEVLTVRRVRPSGPGAGRDR